MNCCFSSLVHSETGAACCLIGSGGLRHWISAPEVNGSTQQFEAQLEAALVFRSSSLPTMDATETDVSSQRYWSEPKVQSMNKLLQSDLEEYPLRYVIVVENSDTLNAAILGREYFPQREVRRRVETLLDGVSYAIRPMPARHLGTRRFEQ
jgi:hypothetical protein